MKYRSTKIACYLGYTVQAIANNFLPLLFVTFYNDYGLGYEKLGRLVLISFLTQLTTDFISIRICDALGYRMTVLLSHVFDIAGLVGLCLLPRVLPPYVGLILSVILYSVGSGMIEVLVSPIMEFLPTTNKSGNMALLHSFYCWGTMATILLTTLFFRRFGLDLWWVMALLWSLPAVINLFLFAKVPLVEPDADEAHITPKEMMCDGRSLSLLLLMLGSGACELAVSDWLSTFAEQSLALPKMWSDLGGPFLFALFMGTGRIIFSFIGDRWDMARLLCGLAIACFVFYLLLAFSPYRLLSLIAGGGVGLGVSVMWPGVFSLATKTFDTGGTAMFGFLALFGDAGCSLGPWVVGFVAQQAGLRMGFFAACAFPLGMALVAVYFMHERKKRA